VTAPKRTPKRPPSIRARAESSGRVSVVGTKGLKVGLIGADVAMVMRLPLASAWMGVYQRRCVGRLLLSGKGDVVDFDKSAMIEPRSLSEGLRGLD